MEELGKLTLFDVETGHLVKRMEMADIIKDMQRSKCRFLTSCQGKLLITDLGMDCVYTLDLDTNWVAVFGKTRSGCFNDTAGLVVDSKGNWLKADSRNHRLCVYTGQGALVKYSIGWGCLESEIIFVICENEY